MYPIAKASITKYWELLKLFFYSKPPASKRKKQTKNQTNKKEEKTNKKEEKQNQKKEEKTK